MTESTQSKEPSLERILEAVLSVSESPVSISRMQKLFPVQGRPEIHDIEQALNRLAAQYASSAMELVNIAHGYRFQTRKTYAYWINKLFQTRPPRLSRVLLETLSIIAYQQPVTRGDIQEVRGVAVSSDIIQRLLEREWVKKIGERDIPGRPSLLAPRPNFLRTLICHRCKTCHRLANPVNWMKSRWIWADKRIWSWKKRQSPKLAQ